MAKTNTNDTQKGVGLHARRIIAYVVLIIISFFCLFWFYIMFINATRSNGELQSGFTAIPSTNLLKNWNNLVHGTLPIWYGMFNSLIIAACSAVLCTYFSTMTAYAIHAYDFKMKRFIYPFILMIMMIPTQVTALGFIKLVTKMGMMDSFIPLIVPTIASPVVFFYMKQYMESALPLSLIEAARIDGKRLCAQQHHGCQQQTENPNGAFHTNASIFIGSCIHLCIFPAQSASAPRGSQTEAVQIRPPDEKK